MHVPQLNIIFNQFAKPLALIVKYFEHKALHLYIKFHQNNNYQTTHLTSITCAAAFKLYAGCVSQGTDPEHCLMFCH